MLRKTSSDDLGNQLFGYDIGLRVRRKDIPLTVSMSACQNHLGAGYSSGSDANAGEAEADTSSLNHLYIFGMASEYPLERIPKVLSQGNETDAQKLAEKKYVSVLWE